MVTLILFILKAMTVRMLGEFITASLLVIGMYHLLLFILQRKDRAPLYFGLFTALFGIRSLMVGELMITQIWPAFPWGLQFKIEYLILCCSGYIITMYFDSIFPNYVSRWFHLGTRIVTGAEVCCKHELKVFFKFQR